MKKTVPIIFSGGSYGTYLHWILHTLTHDVPIIDPGRENGNSHGFRGKHLFNMDGWNRYVLGSMDQSFVRFHPKTSKSESIQHNVNLILSTGNKIIHLYPDEKSYLLVIHNYLYKIWDTLWDGGLRYIRKEDVYQGWNIDPNTPLDQIPKWVQREYFSFNIFPSWESQVEWYLPEVLPENTNYRYFLVGDLLYDFENTIIKIKDYLDLKFTKSIKELLPHHQINLKRQKFLHQQHLADSIIEALLSNSMMSWKQSDLTIFTESWIQHRLRNLGYSIKCHGLDDFPTNSVQLRKLLYRT